MANRSRLSTCFKYLTLLCLLYVCLRIIPYNNIPSDCSTVKEYYQTISVQVPSNDKMHFLQFNRVRKVASSFVYILSCSELSISYKLAYFKLAFQFLRVQQNLLNLNSELLQEFNLVKKNLDDMVNESSKKQDQLDENALNEFINGFKKFYRRLKNDYMVVSENHRNNCQIKMRKLEGEFAERIEQIQRGNDILFAE